MAVQDTVAMILLSDSIQGINFSFQNITISASNYAFIALAIAGNTSVKFDFVVEQGAAASYSSDSNTYSFPNATYGMSDAFEKMTIVHESTHAVIDSLSTKSPIANKLTNETAAYIAGGLYNVLTGSHFNPGAGIYSEAHKLALSIKKNIDEYNYKGIYNITADRAAALQSSILAYVGPDGQPLYTGMSQNYADNGVAL